MSRVPLRRAATAGVAIVALLSASVPAHAQFGGIVFDPTNYAQNVLTAARELQQINNQIQSLENQATSLINQARNLASLPMSMVTTITSQIQRTEQLIQQAQSIALSVTTIDQAYTSKYGAGAINLSQSDQQLIDGAKSRWQTSLDGYQDSLKVQAGIVGNIPTTRTTMNSLTTASQSATGALQATQAGNQLLALQTQQLADLTAAIAAQARAQDLEAARVATEQAQAQEQYRRFAQPTPYTPASVQAFHN